MAPGIESQEGTEAANQIFGSPFQRGSDPAIEYWSLTPAAEKRIADNTLPPHLSAAATAVLHRLSQIGPSEEDEIADWLNMTIKATHDLMRVIQGYGLVALSTGTATASI
jgi:hypothetical protein